MIGHRASSWVWLLHSSSQLITSLNCLRLGQAVHWLQKGQPALPIWDRSPAGLLHPWHPQPLSPDLALLFFPGSWRARQDNQGKRKKGPRMPSGLAASSHHRLEGCPREVGPGSTLVVPAGAPHGDSVGLGGCFRDKVVVSLQTSLGEDSRVDSL